MIFLSSDHLLLYSLCIHYLFIIIIIFTKVIHALYLAFILSAIIQHYYQHIIFNKLNSMTIENYIWINKSNVQKLGLPAPIKKLLSTI